MQSRRLALKATTESQRESPSESPLLIPTLLDHSSAESIELDVPQPKAIQYITWDTLTPVKKASSTIDLKFPIDIKNIIPRDTILQDAFGRCTTKTYDVTCFSSIKYTMTQLGFALKKMYGQYQWRIYAYRSTKRGSSKSTVISKLKLDFNFDHAKKFIHVNVELLPCEEVREETCDESQDL